MKYSAIGSKLLRCPAVSGYMSCFVFRNSDMDHQRVRAQRFFQKQDDM
jgi:hypothetical protein